MLSKVSTIFGVLLGTATVCCWAPLAAAQEAELRGHWPLATDANDISEFKRHAVNHGVSFAGEDVDGWPAASFNGRDAWLEVPAADELRLGTDDFTFALWLHTTSPRSDGQGDLIGWYDPAERRGVNLTLKSLSGVTNAQPNDRHLFFGVDAGTAGEWVDRGRPGEALYILALCVYQDQLYAATFESGDRSGHVYRFDGQNGWIDCGSPDGANSVMSLAVYDGHLYAGTGRYNAGGSALPASPNEEPGGHVYRLEGDATWVDCGRLGEANEAFSLAVFDESLYAIPLYSQGLYRYRGETNWANCGSPGKRLMALTVHDGALYAAGNEGGDSGGVYRYTPDDGWSVAGYQAGVSQVYSFAMLDGKMHVGTWPEGKVFRDDGEPDWSSAGRLGEELEVMGMAPYNGKLYAGTLPLAAVYRYDGDDHWESTGRLDTTPDVRYRRAWSMAVFNGQLFCGTLPSGRVHSYEAGRCLSYDRALSPGWHHVAALRRGDTLELYVDGRRVGHAKQPAPFDLTVQQPLRIGFGAHDYFQGSLRDVRLYRGALRADDIAELVRSGGPGR